MFLLTVVAVNSKETEDFSSVSKIQAIYDSTVCTLLRIRFFSLSKA